MKMKHITRLLLFALLAGLIFGAPADAPFKPEKEPDLAVVFDYDPTALAELFSNQIQIATDVAFTTDSIVKDIFWLYSRHPGEPRNKRPIFDHISSLSDGVYYLRCKVYASEAKGSVWSKVFTFEKDWEVPITPAPAPPTGCRFGRTG